MDNATLSKVSAAFLANPKSLIDSLIAARGLKGNILACIQQTLAVNMSRSELQSFLWLLFTPKIASIILTEGRCNLSCRMCGGSKGELKSLAPKELRTILEHIPTIELVTFVAGNSEPLLHPSLPEILRILKEFNVNADIVTNGHLLTSSLTSIMLDCQRPTSLNISLDAATPSTYHSIRGASFEHVVGNLLQLRDEKKRRGLPWPRRALLMVGMADNIAELPAMVDLAAELDAFRVHVDHLKGNYAPGDFTTCPDWRAHVTEAIRRSETNNVLLQLPADVHMAIPRPNVDQGPSQPNVGIAKPTPRPPQPIPPSPIWTHCSWLTSVFINLDGSMTPCCHHLKKNGNIFAAPIWNQSRYLLYRMKNFQGQVEPFCMTTRNCAYTEEQRALGLIPPMMEVTQ